MGGEGVGENVPVDVSGGPVGELEHSF
jgi:hypothetical protein